MKIFKRFTKDEHKELALILRRINAETAHWIQRVSKHYGLVSKETRSMVILREALSKFRSAMDSALLTENKNTPPKYINFYYDGDDYSERL